MKKFNKGRKLTAEEKAEKGELEEILKREERIQERQQTV